MYTYKALHIFSQLYTANHATFPIQMTQLQYRFAVISEAPSIHCLESKDATDIRAFYVWYTAGYQIQYLI